MFHCPHRLRRAHWCVAWPVLLGVHTLLFSAPVPSEEKAWTTKQHKSNETTILQLGFWPCPPPPVKVGRFCLASGNLPVRLRDITHLGIGESSANFIHQILLSEEFCMLYWARKAGFTAFVHDCPFSSCMSVQLIYA